MAFGLNDLVRIGTGGLIPDITGQKAAAAASAAGQAANQAAIGETQRQFDITQQNLAPFLQAGTQAIPTYQQDIGGAPQAPTLGQFSFDVNQAMQDPGYLAQLAAGQQQLDRISGKTGQLSSGNRLYDVLQYGQGLANQNLGQQYNRQLQTYGTNQNTALKNYGLASDRYNQRMNRLAGLIDVGRGTGSALGQLGAQSSGNIAGLLQQQGQLQGAEALAQNQGINNLLNMGATTLGAIYGGPAGAAIGGSLIGGGTGTPPSMTYGSPNIGFQPSSQGFF